MSKKSHPRRLDDTDVPDFVVIDQVPAGQRIEETPYPKPGDPNPRVRLGVVAATGGGLYILEMNV